MTHSRHALIVDDVEELRQATSELVERLGYRVTAAASGEEALKLAAQTQAEIDVVVSDVFMPGISGLELVDQLRQQRPQLPVVLVSSRASHPSIQGRFRQGDVMLLPKPFSVSALRDALAEAESRSEAPRMTPPPSKRAAQAGARSRWLLALPTALALLGLAALIPALRQAPSLPERPASSIQRGGHLEPLFPLGETASAPDSFGWRQIEGASQYRLTLRAVDQEILWETLAPRSPVLFPSEVGQSLRSAVTYLWSVEALDETGERLAWSEQTQFHLAFETPSEKDVSGA